MKWESVTDDELTQDELDVLESFTRAVKESKAGVGTITGRDTEGQVTKSLTVVNPKRGKMMVFVVRGNFEDVIVAVQK